MRVIAGIAKKRRLKSPGKLSVRPTLDRVKESLFNIILPKVSGSCFADLYAGTGGVGIEALSRGAQKVVFVENNPKVVAVIRENLQLTGLGANAEIIQRDLANATRWMQQKHYLFDIIFADPPYQQGLAEETLNLLCQYPLLHNQGILIIETSIKEALPGPKGPFKLVRRERYGDTALTFFELQVGED